MDQNTISQTSFRESAELLAISNGGAFQRQSLDIKYSTSTDTPENRPKCAPRAPCANTNVTQSISAPFSAPTCSASKKGASSSRVAGRQRSGGRPCRLGALIMVVVLVRKLRSSAAAGSHRGDGEDGGGWWGSSAPTRVLQPPQTSSCFWGGGT